jgi:rhodanese-related sulfurtransferase
MKFIITFRSKHFLIATVLILGLSIQVPAAAGNLTTYNANETFNSISAIPQVRFNRHHEQHDASFAITPDAVLYKLKQKQKITLIDVRNPEDFERLHIPGSLNIPLHAVKTKVFLKSFPLVLLNEGFHYSVLQSECRQLTDLGFKAFILDGGLPAWKREGSRLVGDPFALQDMRTVSPRVFLGEKNYGNMLVIDISPVQTEISRQLMPYSRHIPVSAEPGEWFRKLNRIITDHKSQPFLSVVVINETGDGYGRANEILADLGVNAFFLQSGVAGYKKHLADLKLSWLPRDDRIKTNRKCRTCSGVGDSEKNKWRGKLYDE